MLDYRFCDRTVTVYRLENGHVHRTVMQGCYYFWQVQQVCDLYGTRQETKFLLIVPGQDRPVQVGDRIYDGVGPEITPEEWPGFLPVTVPGLGQVAYVRPIWWDGRITHTEAGNQ